MENNKPIIKATTPKSDKYDTIKKNGDVDMKTPLRFQVTEYDCGTVSLYNAISYLFDREEIPAQLLKTIHKYTLDCYDDKGNPGQGGTSKEAIEKIASFMTKYTNSNNFGIKCEKLDNDEITIDKLAKCVKENGCIFVRVLLETGHYVIITKIIKDKAYIFDPYYLDKNKYKDKEEKIVLNKPFTHNRVVSLKRLFSETNKDFAFGDKNKRECVLMNRI